MFETSTVLKNKRKIQAKSKTKYNALQDIENGMSKKHVCEKYEIPSSTLSTWKKLNGNIFNEFRSNDLRVKRKRLNNEKYSQVNAAVYKWFIQMRAKDFPLNGPVLKVKASEFATSFGCDDFKASEGWLGKFKTRHGISFKEVAGEENAVTADMTASWNETALSTILSKFT